MTTNLKQSPTTSPTSRLTDLAADPVLASVAAYSEHVDAYESFNADKMGDDLDRFIADLSPWARVLDAGCGPGRDLRRMVDAGLSPIGVDLNADFVARASQHGPARVADLRDLPFHDETFDATWACASLVHLPVEDAILALSELRRVTKTGAPVAVSVKIAGSTGWVETPHGNRWFQIWDATAFADIVTSCGLSVQSVTVGPVFVDVLAAA